MRKHLMLLLLFSFVAACLFSQDSQSRTFKVVIENFTIGSGINYYNGTIFVRPGQPFTADSISIGDKLFDDMGHRYDITAVTPTSGIRASVSLNPITTRVFPIPGGGYIVDSNLDVYLTSFIESGSEFLPAGIQARWLLNNILILDSLVATKTNIGGGSADNIYTADGIIPSNRSIQIDKLLFTNGDPDDGTINLYAGTSTPPAVVDGSGGELYTGFVLNDVNETGNTIQIGMSDVGTGIFTDSYFSISAPDGLLLSTYDSGTSIELPADGNSMKIKGTNPVFSGIEYLSDYSANFNDRSLVDKAYVDASQSGSIYNMSDTLLQPITLTTSSGNGLTIRPEVGNWITRFGDDGYPAMTITDMENDDQLDVGPGYIYLVDDLNGAYNYTELSSSGISIIDADNSDGAFGLYMTDGQIELYDEGNQTFNSFKANIEVYHARPDGVDDVNTPGSMVFVTEILDGSGNAREPLTGESLFILGASTSSSASPTAGIKAIAQETYGAGFTDADNSGSSLSLFTTRVGVAGVQDRLLITHDGNLLYASDMSSIYTDRSLVDKAYVDTSSLFIGVTDYENAVGDGFSQKGIRNLDDSNFETFFTVNTLDGEYKAASGVFNTATDDFATIETTDRRHSIEATFNGIYSEVVVGGTYGGVTIRTETTNPAVGLSSIELTDTMVFVTNSAPGTVFKGIEYGHDYSAQFSDRSLIDKAYVDSNVKMSGFVKYTTSNSITVNNGFTFMVIPPSSTTAIITIDATDLEIGDEINVILDATSGSSTATLASVGSEVFVYLGGDNTTISSSGGSLASHRIVWTGTEFWVL